MREFFAYVLLAGFLCLPVACSKNTSLLAPTNGSTPVATISSPTSVPTLSATPGVTLTPTLSFTPTTYPGLTYTTYDAPFPYLQMIAIFLNKIWLLPGGGNYPQIWSSADGANWTNKGSNTDLEMISGNKPIVFKNQLFLIGGMVGNSVSSSAPSPTYSTSDGINWSQVGSLGTISQRLNPSLMNFNNKLWMTGGDFYVNSGNGTKSIKQTMCGIVPMASTGQR
jgi:hypothetical protein